jgi:hypothetical protein
VRDAHSDAYPHRKPDSDSYSDINTNTDFDSDSYSNTDFYTQSHSQAASDSAPAPDTALKGIVICDR